MNTRSSDDTHRGLFINTLVSGTNAHLLLQPGIKLGTSSIGKSRGLMLHIAREALQTGQLQSVLERRFESAVALSGCYIYLDGQNNLIIWHSMPQQAAAVDRVFSRLLWLAGLSALDVPANR